MRIELKRFLFPVVLLVTSTTLLACSATREYKQPDVQLPAAYRGSSPAAPAIRADSALAAMPYRSFFTDPALRELIEGAVAENIDLQVALKNIDFARQTLNSAKLGNLPTVSLGVTASQSRPSDNGSKARAAGDKTLDEYIASGSASWEADIWGKIRSRKSAALAGYLKTGEAAKAIHTRLVADVAAGYYNLLMLDEQLLSSQKNLALADTTLRMIRLQYDAGQLTTLAVQQQEASRESIALSLPVIEQKIAAQENALSILSGKMPASIHRQRALFTIKFTDDLSAGIPVSLLQNRSDVRAAELAVREAYANTGEAKANLYPSLTLSAQGGVDALSASRWFTFPGSLFSFVQGAVVQPVFQHGELRAKYEQSKIKQQQSELEFKRSLLKAVAEVSDALVAIEKIKSEEVIAARRLATLQSAVANAGMLFNSGMATYLEVILAQTNALQAELTLADIRRQHLVALSELYRSLGGGWQ